MNVKLTAGGVADLLRGIGWFDRIVVGLGDQFEQDFYDALDRIKQLLVLHSTALFLTPIYTTTNRTLSTAECSLFTRFGLRVHRRYPTWG